ncbi:unnamed protein product, partial [Ectocarpus sp. 4 AP-2014]
EELELGEGVNFQLPGELDAGRRWLEAGQTLVLQMELMFSKLASLEADNNTSKKATNGVGGEASGGVAEEEEDEGEDVLDLKPVAVQRFEASLSAGHWGLHAYVPVTFSGVHFVRVDCMVHGVLRNLKLEAPKTGDEVVLRPTTAGAQASLEADGPAAATQTVQRKAAALPGGDGEADLEESSPASLVRLESRDGGGYNNASAGAARGAEAEEACPSAAALSLSPSTPKYTWFSLYDEQGAGARRMSSPRIGSDAVAGGKAGSVDNNGGGGGGGGAGPDASTPPPKKAEGSWRWGWGRKGSASKMAAAVAATAVAEPGGQEGAKTDSAAGASAASAGAEAEEAAEDEGALAPSAGEETAAGVGCSGGQAEVSGGGEGETGEDGEGRQVPSVLEGEPSARKEDANGASAAVAAGKRLAESVERERKRLRRKDVYSYFMMPLMRALELQTGTTLWLRKLLEADGSKEIPASAVPLWVPPDPSCEEDVTRVLGRLFAPSTDIASVSEDEQEQEQSSPLAGGNTCGPGTPRTKGTNGAPPISGAPHGYYMPPAPAKVAYPALINRYCGGVSKTRNGDASVGRRPCWMNSDDKTCAALERDVHALAMLVFVEWREFVSALPGCGAALSKETSALWFAQLRQRWACQATLHTLSATQPLSLDPAAATAAAEPGTRPPSPALDGSGRASKFPTSEPGSPRLSRLEPELAADHFGAAVRMACADASAPYKLPLRDQHMFPDGDVGLPVCLVQRYEYAPKEEGGGGGGGGRGRKAVREIRQGSGGGGGLAAATVDKEKLVDEDRSRSQSPVKPTAAGAAAAVERFGGLGRRGRSGSSSPPGMQIMAAAAATGGGGGDSGAGGGRRGEKPFRSLSPLLTKGKVFFSPGGKARWPSSKSPARNHRRSPAAAAAAATTATAGEGADDATGNAAAAAAAGSSRNDGDRSDKDEDGAGGAGDGSSGGSSSPGDSNDASGAESAGKGAEETTGRYTEIPAPGIATEVAFTDSRHAKMAVLPPPPPPPPTPYSTPPQPSSSSRRGGEGPKPRGPSTPIKGGVLQASSPLRKTPVASPARPPLKPMAVEQQQKQRELRREESSSSAAGGDTGGNGRRPGGRPSLLDGVEQSSDLGAFFRQGETGGRRRRGRRLSPGRRGAGSLARGVLRRSPPRRTRAFAGGGGEKDQDEDEEEEEEEEEEEDEEEEEAEEHGCGAGVGVHVIVLHHGYCGSSMDMRLIKNYIRILAPDALVLNAESNERDPHASMKMMGEKLAKEVHR